MLTLLRRTWRKVNEPRAITMLTALGYAVLAFGGISALISPPRSIEGTVGDVAMMLLAAGLTTGGTLGAITSVPGWQWLERGAVLLCGASLGIYAVIVIIMGINAETGNRDLQTAAVLFSAIMVVTRGVYIWNRPYAARAGDKQATNA